jgi:sec-independent protein translocase protein TatC
MSKDKNMSFLEHFGELRGRLLRVFAAVAVGMGICLYFTPRILKLLLLPYGSVLKVIGPTEGISNYLRIGLVGGAALAMPWILVEAWGFVSPALKPREKRYVGLLVPLALAMFLGGIAFAWFVLIPAAIGFLSTFTLDVFKVEWTSENYIPFVTSLIFWIGVCFELPLVMFFLAKIRVVSARWLLKGWRYAVVLIAAAAAVITPTVDPFNLMLVALPLVALYFFGILLAFFARRGPDREAAEPRQA